MGEVWGTSQAPTAAVPPPENTLGTSVGSPERVHGLKKITDSFRSVFFHPCQFALGPHIYYFKFSMPKRSTKTLNFLPPKSPGRILDFSTSVGGPEPRGLGRRSASLEPSQFINNQRQQSTSNQIDTGCCWWCRSTLVASRYVAYACSEEEVLLCVLLQQQRVAV